MEETREMIRQVSVNVDHETYEKVARACSEPGFWRTFTTYKDAPLWVYTQELGSRHVVDFNVYAPRDTHNPADEESACWCEAVIFERDPDNSKMLHEQNCVLGDDDPFTTPWLLTLDDVDYEVRFTAR